MWQQSKYGKKNKRLTSSAAYSNVCARIDSGLNRSNRSKSQTDLRFKDSDQHPVEMLALFREAKAEIINLKKIVEHQQILIDTLMRQESPHRLLTTTTTTTTTTRASNVVYGLANTNGQTMIALQPRQLITNEKHHKEDGLSNKFQEQDEQDADDPEPSLAFLWTRYQQIVAHKKSSEQISSDIRVVVERLYQALQDAQERINLLSCQVPSKCPQIGTVLDQEQKQMEMWRRENVYLHDSLSQFAKQVIHGSDATMSPSQSNLDDESIRLKQEIQTLQARLHDSNHYRHMYESMLKINETDQLKITHLEDKVARLSSILFDKDHNLALKKKDSD